MANLEAYSAVLSGEWASTTITSKSRLVWRVRSFRSGGKYFSSLRVGMMMEMKGI